MPTIADLSNRKFLNKKIRITGAVVQIFEPYSASHLSGVLDDGTGNIRFLINNRRLIGKIPRYKENNTVDIPDILGREYEFEGKVQEIKQRKTLMISDFSATGKNYRD